MSRESLGFSLSTCPAKRRTSSPALGALVEDEIAAGDLLLLLGRLSSLLNRGQVQPRRVALLTRHGHGGLLERGLGAEAGELVLGESRFDLLKIG